MQKIRVEASRNFCTLLKFKFALGKTAKSILISCGARLSPFDIEEVRNLVMYDELELDKLGGYIVEKTIMKTNKNGKKVKALEKVIKKEKRALFVIISDTDSSFNVRYRGWK